MRCGRAGLIHETDPKVIFTQTKSKTRHHDATATIPSSGSKTQEQSTQTIIFRACDEKCWTHDSPTPRRPEKITEGSSSRMGLCCERNKALKYLALHCLYVMIMVIFMAHQAQDGDCCHQLQMSTAT